MAGAKKVKKLDIHREVAQIWQEAKGNLRALGKRTLRLAKKGEKGVVKASKLGKLQLDIVSMNLKKENAFRQAGKKAYEMHSGNKHIEASKLVTYFNQIDKLDQQIKDKKAQIDTLKKTAEMSQ